MNWIDGRETIFGQGIINIFCDASIKKLGSGETLGFPGAIYMSNDALDDKNGDRVFTLPSMDLLRHSTNNHAEIYAIWMAYDIAKRLYTTVGGNPRINIFSDSQISVYGLRDWIFSWVNSAQGHNLVSSTGRDVANQDIYKSIVLDMINSQVPIYLYHTKGHVNINSLSDIKNAKRVFDTSNGTDVSLNAMTQISYGNDLVDVTTKKKIDEFITEFNVKTHTNDPIKPYEVSLVDANMELYKELLGGN